jgi:hypothetical protein
MGDGDALYIFTFDLTHRVKKALPGLEKPIRILAGQYYDAETGLHYT